MEKVKRMKKMRRLTYALFFLCIPLVSFSEGNLGSGGKVYLQKETYALLGKNIAEGDMFPVVELTSPLSVVHTIGNDKGRVYVVVPKIGTSVCDAQIKALNVFVRYYKGVDIDFFVVSRDAPEAQEVFKKENNISDKVKFLSAKTDSFGLVTGTAVDGIDMLARAVFFVDDEGRIGKIVRYEDILKAPDAGEEIAILLGSETCECDK